MALISIQQVTLLALLTYSSATIAGVETNTLSLSEAALRRYLSMPVEPGKQNEPYQFSGRMERLAILRDLGATSNAVAAIEGVLASLTNGWQRSELAECLGRDVQTKESASLLTRMLKDPDKNVRGAALHGIRLMACRIDRGGRHGIQVEPAHPPKIEGLLPAIISAANDKSTKVRAAAMYALADTREPQAFEEMRKHLTDADRGVRFNAACLLTEVRDASGMDELRQAMKRVQSYGPQDSTWFHLEAENLLLALERITGKSFGEIPLNPILSSDLRKGDEYSKEYHRLVKAWADWLEKNPSAK